MARRFTAGLRLSERRFDILLAGVIVALTQRDIWAQQGDSMGIKTSIAAALFAATASLVWRRRAALWCAVLLAAALAVQTVLSKIDYSSAGTALAVLVSLYSIGAYIPMPRALLAFAIDIAGLGTGELRDLHSYAQDPGNAAFWWLLAATSIGVGIYVRSRRRGAQLTRLAREIEVESAEHARVAVAEERARIARELHDVVAHDVSAVVLHAEAAEDRLTAEPEQALESLHTIQRLGREALAEMRRAVGVMRAPEEGGAATPAPVLSDLPLLIERSRAAGLRIAYSIEGDPRALSPGLEVSAYRIVQEALTNVRKHADGARVSVGLCYGRVRFEIHVCDDGPGAPIPASSTGHGLIGIRERVDYFGGMMTAGNQPTGGFAVHASLPIPAT